jgi:hypothetical protein
MERRREAHGIPRLRARMTGRDAAVEINRNFPD